MKTRPLLSVPSAAITISMLCFAQPPTTCNQAALFEAFEGLGFTGSCFGSPQVPSPMPFKPRSLKIQTNSVLEFRVDNGISDNAGALISRGPASVPNLAALPRRSQDGLGNVGPAGNFDGVIVSVIAGRLPAPNVHDCPLPRGFGDFSPHSRKPAHNVVVTPALRSYARRASGRAR